MIELRLMAAYFCPTRMVAQYEVKGGTLDGKSIFCEVLGPRSGARWFKEFNTAEAYKADITAFERRERPDIVFENGELRVVEQ